MSGFRSFNKANRCPLCNGDHSCQYTADGLHFCRRNHGEDVYGWFYLKESSNGVWGLYRREEDRQSFKQRQRSPHSYQRSAAHDTTPTPSPNPSKPAHDPAHALREWLAHPARELCRLPGASAPAERWAAHLNLPDPNVFEMLDTQYLTHDNMNAGDLLVFPERDGKGEIVGYTRRYKDGRKLAVGRRGLSIPRALTPTSAIEEGGPLYVVEGASDTLALLTMGRNVIGRPSATGGVEQLAEFIYSLPRERWDVIVVGENDQKESGLWPGREGAYRVAARLAETLGIYIRVAFPPAPSKDSRDWMIADIKANRKKPFAHSEGLRAGTLFAHHAYTTADVVKPGEVIRHQSSGIASLGLPVLIAGLLSASPLGSDGVAATVPVPINFDDLSGETIGREVERARAAGEIAPAHDDPALEAAAHHEIDAMRSDFTKYPCGRIYRELLRSKTTGNPWILERRCGLRNCPGCRRFKDDRELSNARLRFAQAERDGDALIRVEVANSAWKALQKRIRDADGEYLRVDLDDDGIAGRSVVFTTANPSNRLPHVVVSAEQAASEIASILPLRDSLKRPVSTSHGWKLPRIDEKSGKFERVCKCDEYLTTAKMIEIVEACGGEAIARVPRIRNGYTRMMWEAIRRDAVGDETKYGGKWSENDWSHLELCLGIGDIVPRSVKGRCSRKWEDVDVESEIDAGIDPLCVWN